LCLSRIGEPIRAFWTGLAFSATSFACAVLAWLGYALDVAAAADLWSAQPYLFGRQLFVLDELSAPLVPLVSLVHFLTVLATGRTKMRRFSLAWSLAYESARLAMFACQVSWVLVVLLAIGTVPGYVELANRGKPTKVYVVHMALFVCLLVGGWTLVSWEQGHGLATAWATLPLLAAVLIRCGTAPVHCWLTDWFEHASFGIALVFVAPLTGVYLAVRLVLPIAPDWVLDSIGIFSLATAIYAAAMAAVQREARRFFAYLFISHASLVLVGLEVHTPVSLTGALALWISVTLSLSGLGLTLRALEARVGRLSLAKFHGLYEHTPMLAVCFLLTGLGTVGFPGTLGFLAAEILVDGVVEANPYIGLGVIVAAAINGIAIVRVYLLLFTGTRHISTVSLTIGMRERLAVLTLIVLILLGGIFPQPGLTSRHRAAVALFEARESRRLAQPPLGTHRSDASAQADEE
jgi:NADH-quinone oxidoreductase subunit M